jgi:hypothetical protein
MKLRGVLALRYADELGQTPCNPWKQQARLLANEESFGLHRRS